MPAFPDASNKKEIGTIKNEEFYKMTEKDIPDITLTVTNPSELPENLSRFYDSLTRNSRVISLCSFGGGFVQATTKEGDTGLFRKDLIPKQGKMYLSYEKHSPLFVVMRGKIMVIAPCEVKGV